jgi:hypothetical protein
MWGNVVSALVEKFWKKYQRHTLMHRCRGQVQKCFFFLIRYSKWNKLRQIGLIETC